MATQLRWVGQCVLAVEKGRSLTEVLPGVPDGLRPGVQALTFDVLRHLGTARALAKVLAQRAPAAPALALLHASLALLARDEAGARYAPHTLVDQAVEAAKQVRETRMQAGFLNACLRRFLRERTHLMAAVASDPVARWNHPAWWVKRVRSDHPTQWERVLSAGQTPPPMVLRVNRRQHTRLDYQAVLAREGIEALPLGEDGLLLLAPVPVERLPGFAQGSCSVQDGSAQLAAGLLLEGREWRPDDRLLDACAAPGGKTAHLLERSDASVVALDVDPRRCRRIDENLQRLGLTATVQVADAAQSDDWWDGQRFDGILLDAPCTASGIVRRHPDARWLRRSTDVAQLVAIQARLLEALWPLLKPGGRLVYATCSVFRVEGADQVDAFLARHSDALAQAAPGHLIPGCVPGCDEFNDNVSGGYDGFFYARLDKAGP
ncbi:MAG TPA: 16S rRNA (cytosine(967)-C(5))-methyltransferase RsmB [Hydrogenophaga sp.]